MASKEEDGTLGLPGGVFGVSADTPSGVLWDTARFLSPTYDSRHAVGWMDESRLTGWERTIASSSSSSSSDTSLGEGASATLSLATPLAATRTAACVSWDPHALVLPSSLPRCFDLGDTPAASTASAGARTPYYPALCLRVSTWETGDTPAASTGGASASSASASTSTVTIARDASVSCSAARRACASTDTSTAHSVPSSSSSSSSLSSGDSSSESFASSSLSFFSFFSLEPPV
jgi:hypothetical protein